MAFPWKRICVPVDFSEPSRTALEHAAKLAATFEAELLLVYVQELVLLPAGPMLPPTVYERLDADARKLLQEWLVEAKRLGAPRVEGELMTGVPFDSIVKLAEAREADLIIIGTHGRTALKHVLLGSVAEKVVRHARCPVLTVRPASS